ncbi:MAG: hypothetical protein WBQ44_16655 [Rhodococcus sp. (in: high G+C Gram-positive bacteria)]
MDSMIFLALLTVAVMAASGAVAARAPHTLVQTRRERSTVAAAATSSRY